MAKSQGLEKGTSLKQGTYRIEKILGSGSFGITYLATAKLITQGPLGQMEVEAKVAVKEFFMNEVNTRQPGATTVEGSTGSVFTNYRKKFKKEAENLSKLSHPNIVKVFDIFDENNTTYYIMEFIDGVNLDDYIKLKGRVPEEEAINIIKEVGDALEYMHSNKMLHLDIKPKNIMRKSDGNCLLIDFGLSKQFNTDGEPESSTSIGLGTPGYSPLEQATYKKSGKFPATLDVYALGATLFKMLTSQRPPDATVILNEGFPEEEFEDSKGKFVSNETLSAVKKAMSPMTSNRFKSIKDFINNLSEDTVVEDDEKKKEEERKKREEEERKRKLEEEERKRREEELRKKAEEEQKRQKQLEEEKRKAQEEEERKKAEKEKKKREKVVGWPWKRIAIITGNVAFWGAALTLCIIAMVKSGDKSESQPNENTVSLPQEIVTSIKERLPQNVTNADWNSPLGPAKYTGQILPLSETQASGDFIPNGHGVAKIVSGKYEGCVYDGTFLNGKMSGAAVYTYPNGDSFKGTFRNNKFEEGQYTSKSTGEYFDGIFKDELPYDGVWYDAKGSKLDNIFEGKIVKN